MQVNIHISETVINQSSRDLKNNPVLREINHRTGMKWKMSRGEYGYNITTIVKKHIGSPPMGLIPRHGMQCHLSQSCSIWLNDFMSGKSVESYHSFRLQAYSYDLKEKK